MLTVWANGAGYSSQLLTGEDAMVTVNSNKPYRRVYITYPKESSSAVWDAINTLRSEHPGLECIPFDNGMIENTHTFDDMFITESHVEMVLEKLLTIL